MQSCLNSWRHKQEDLATQNRPAQGGGMGALGGALADAMRRAQQPPKR